MRPLARSSIQRMLGTTFWTVWTEMIATDETATTTTKNGGLRRVRCPRRGTRRKEKEVAETNLGGSVAVVCVCASKQIDRLISTPPSLDCSLSIFFFGPRLRIFIFFSLPSIKSKQQQQQQQRKNNKLMENDGVTLSSPSNEMLAGRRGRHRS